MLLEKFKCQCAFKRANKFISAITCCFILYKTPNDCRWP